MSGSQRNLRIIHPPAGSSPSRKKSSSKSNKRKNVPKDSPSPLEDRKYERLGSEIGSLVDEKNQAYGDSFNTTGDALRLLFPEGIKPEQMDDALALARIWDKMSRIARDNDPFGESPYNDIAGYAILGSERLRRRNN